MVWILMTNKICNNSLSSNSTANWNLRSSKDEEVYLRECLVHCVNNFIHATQDIILFCWMGVFKSAEYIREMSLVNWMERLSRFSLYFYSSWFIYQWNSSLRVWFVRSLIYASYLMIVGAGSSYNYNIFSNHLSTCGSCLGG